MDEQTDGQLTADALNRYYAAISTDPAYVPAKRKLTMVGSDEYFTEYDVFNNDGSSEANHHGTGWYAGVVSTFNGPDYRCSVRGTV